MAVKTEQVEKNLVKIIFEVGPEKFEEGMQKAYLKNRKKYNVPGFRKGKVPRAVVEKYYSESVFYDDAINYVLPEAYEAAIEEADVQPVARPEIDVDEIKKGENIVFTALITTKPDVTLGDYIGVEVEKIEHTVTDEDVDKDIEETQKKNARMVGVDDRTVEKGDITVIDFEGFVDGEAFEGGKGEGYELEIGSGQFIPGFEDQLIGAKLDELVDVNVTFPEEYHAPELAGKDANFKVVVHEIKMRELPELDDDFASEVSDCETFDAYKKSVRERLEEDAQTRAKNETENAVIDKVVENAQVEIPDVMVENQIDNLLRDFNQRLAYQGLNLETYVQYTGNTMEALREQFRAQAEKQVRGSLVLEAVSKQENVEVGPEELEMHLMDMAKQYNMEVEKLKELFSDADMESVKKEVVMTKTIQMLVNKAVVK
jgi:trigger factor